MGRKTWESIPEKFRPLKGRLNIVLSRSYPLETWDGKGDDKEPVKLSSLASVLLGLSKITDVAKVFVIGGAEIYTAALEDESTKRILLTRVLTDFDCDTFFPTRLEEGDGGEWKKKTRIDLDHWVGEEVPEGIQEEDGTRYVFEMYERD
jgi:dihydrofolate reductase